MLPGDGLLDPVAVVALAALLVNDHLAKAWARGTAWAVVTGKVSDVAGVLFLPVLVVAGLELVSSWRARRAGCAWSGPQQLPAVVGAVAVGLAFAAMKTIPAAGHAYALTLGALQWPFHALGAALAGAAPPPLLPVRHVVDPTDVLAVPAALYVVRQARCRVRSWARSGATKALNAAR